MNPAVKVFATLALSAAVGEKIKNVRESKYKIEAGEKLRAAGYKATGLYPYQALSAKKVDQIGQAVENLLNEPMEPQEIISMLLAGLSDICAHIKSERIEIINPVIDELRACLDLYDDPDHVQAFERYERWAS